MDYFDTYKKRLFASGETERDRTIKALKESLSLQAPNSPSYKEVKINDSEEVDYLTIVKGTKASNKKFQCLEKDKIFLGDYVNYANTVWLVDTYDFDNEVYTNGTLRQCNYLLKWQNDKGEIITRWAVVTSASKYNDGQDDGKMISLGSDQLLVRVTVDKESLSIRDNKKFFIDNGNTKKVYELTGNNNVPDTYNDHGITAWIVKETTYSPTENDLKYGVCEYFSPTEDNTPTDTWYMKIDCPVKTIRVIDGEKEITAQLYDKDGKPITDEITYEWTIVSEISDYITYKTELNKITLSLKDNYDSYADEIVIKCASKYTGQSDSITLITKEVF